MNAFVCLAEPALQRAMLSLNATGAIRFVPRSAFRPVPQRGGRVPSSERVDHWVAVLDHGERLAVRTVEARGDYAAAAAVTVAMADVLTVPNRTRAGVFTPEAVLSLHELAPILERRGIHVVERDGEGRRRRRSDELSSVPQVAS